MAIYEIDGSTYELPDDVKGEVLNKTLQSLAKPAEKSAPQAPANDPDANVKKFLNVLGKAEGAGYNTIVGGSSFSDYSAHPGIVGLVTAEGPSTAAGKYQITKTTYDRKASELGITDFSPESQDRIAIALIEEKNALEDIRNGDFNSAINKLGGVWASLPSSPYSQPKKSAEWMQAQLNSDQPISTATTFSDSPAAPVARGWTVRKNVDPSTLNSDGDWLRASKMLYQLAKGDEFVGSDKEAAEWGKDYMGYFNFNLPVMAAYAADISMNGTQEQKEAFLYMMDTYDNTQWSWEGAGRAAAGIFTDPTTYLGLGSLGIGTVAKFAGAESAKQGAKSVLLKSLGRTGIAAGIEGGIYGATTETIRQGVEVSAGRRDSVDLGDVATSAGVTAVGGVVLGTAADAAVSKIAGLVKKPVVEVGKPEIRINDPEIPGASPSSVAETPNSTSTIAPEGTIAKVDGLPPSETPKAADDLPNVFESNRPLGETLTPEEIAQATARKQEGRLPEDDIIPKFPEDAPPVEVRVPEMNTGLRSTPMAMDDLTKLGGEVSAQLKVLSNDDLGRAMEQFRTNSGNYSIEENRIIGRGIQMAADELRIKQAEILKKINSPNVKPDDIPKLQAELDAIETRMVPLELADDAFGSMAGSILRQRQEGLPGVTGMSVESIMKETGVSRKEAELAYIKAIGEAQQSAESQKIIKDLDAQIDQALKENRLGDAMKIASMKYRHLESLADASVKGGSSFMQKLSELAISNVFSVSTLIVNVVPSGLKTVVVPLVKLLVTNPLEKANRVEMAATYSGMKSSLGGAWRAAKAAYRYEQAILTRDGTRLLEGELAMTGRKAGVLRFFPRVLNASDELLSQINYRGFISGKIAGDAYVEGAEKGLTGKALNEYVAKEVEQAMTAAFKPESGDVLVRPIINKGINLGFTGEKLAKFVEKEAMRDPEALRHGNSEDALNYVRDVLYKRRFSGEGKVSQAAREYERMTNKFSSMKFVLGQLFFRTPVRVFEEGVRLTPGVQILAPGFISDLAGKNGELRQVRAQGEAMVSLAMAGTVLSLYSQGRITGDGAYNDWKQQRARGDTDKAPPYTIKMSDGTYWSYRNFDPIATPIKIMVNGFERMHKLDVRRAQGEFVDASAYDNAMAYISVGTTAIASAIRDANLVAGLNTTIKWVENLSDPEAKEDATIKLFGEKLALLVPNTLTKIAKTNDPTIKDPVTFWQVVETRLAAVGFDKADVKPSFAYDAVGNPRQITDTDALWSLFTTVTPSELQKGRTADDIYTLNELDRLSAVTGTTFALPFKHPKTGDLDYRSVMTVDGKQTMYDRWNQLYNELQPGSVLKPYLESELPDGTFKEKGLRVNLVREQMNNLWNIAHIQLMAEQQPVIDRMINEILRKTQSKFGSNDFKQN